MQGGSNSEVSTRSSSPVVGIAIDIVVVLLSATLLVLPIEDPRFWPTAFIALVPILLRMWIRSYWAIFLTGFVTFYLYLFYSLQWIDVYGLHWRLALAFVNSVSYATVFVIAFWIMRRYRSHFFATVLPTLILLLEYKQSIGFLGFPWPILCHTQSGNLPLIQVAAITGCWGVTWLVVHVNEALAHLIAGGFKPRVLTVGIAPITLIALVGLYGAVRIAQGVTDPHIPVTIVQWDRATNVRWTREFNRSSIDAYTELTIDELAAPTMAESTESEASARLVIWPETAVPNAITDQLTMNRIRQLANTYDATFIVGCIAWEAPDAQPIDIRNHWRVRDEYLNYNSMVDFEPDGSVTPFYAKIHLVPFGEVIPLKELITDWFPDYPWGAQDVSPGNGFRVVSTRAGEIGAVVCYESVFPQIARNVVNNGAEILVLGSNTSWFGRTKASFQHARFDIFRAVENGIWFCRAATTGVSSVIDPLGHVVAETRLFEADAFTVLVGLRTGKTLYTRWGDWLPLLCGIYFMLLMFGAVLIREEEDESGRSASK